MLDDVPVAAIQIVGDGLALRLDAEAALALLAGGNPVVCDETAT
jgi:hypothetical protein